MTKINTWHEDILSAIPDDGRATKDDIVKYVAKKHGVFYCDIHQTAGRYLANMCKDGSIKRVGLGIYEKA